MFIAFYIIPENSWSSSAKVEFLALNLIQLSFNMSLWEKFWSEALEAQSCLTLCDPMDPPGSSVPWILLARILAAAAKSLWSCPTLCDPRDGSPPGSPSLGFSRQEHCSRFPFISPLLHESEVAQSCPTLSDPMDCSPLGSSVHGIFQASKNTGVGSNSLLHGLFPTQGSNPGLPHCRQILYNLNQQRSLW